MTAKPESDAALDAVTERFVDGRPGLRLLILYGSRARGDAGPTSDWDFGFLGHAQLDTAALLAELVEALGRDDVDLVDLERANGQLRFRAAGDARVIHEAEPGAFQRFWFDAVSFWCDMGPIIRRGYDAVLKRVAS